MRTTNTAKEKPPLAAAKEIRLERNPNELPYLALVRFAKGHGFTVTSTTGGKHNPGSAHYQGRAIDVRTRDKTDAQVDEFIRSCHANRIGVRDERKRPPRQKVWSGPHLHLELS